VTSKPAAAPKGAAPLAKTGDGSVPKHVAIIMDGNGRWASQRGLPRVAGHRAGAEAVRKTLRAAAECGVDTLTLYAFSSENWRRPEDEIADLKGLLGYYLERELNSLAKEGVRLKLIGNYAAFGPDLVSRLEKAEANFKGVFTDVRNRSAWDDTFVDALCEPPETFSFGGTFAHVITFNMYRRMLAIDALRWLGVKVEGVGCPMEYLESLGGRASTS